MHSRKSGTDSCVCPLKEYVLDDDIRKFCRRLSFRYAICAFLHEQNSQRPDRSKLQFGLLEDEYLHEDNSAIKQTRDPRRDYPFNRNVHISPEHNADAVQRGVDHYPNLHLLREHNRQSGHCWGIFDYTDNRDPDDGLPS